MVLARKSPERRTNRSIVRINWYAKNVVMAHCKPTSTTEILNRERLVRKRGRQSARMTTNKQVVIYGSDSVNLARFAQFDCPVCRIELLHADIQRPDKLEKRGEAGTKGLRCRYKNTAALAWSRFVVNHDLDVAVQCGEKLHEAFDRETL